MLFVDAKSNVEFDVRFEAQSYGHLNLDAGLDLSDCEESEKAPVV